MLIPIKVQFKMAKTYHHIMKLSYNYHKLTTDTVPLWLAGIGEVLNCSKTRCPETFSPLPSLISTWQISDEPGFPWNCSQFLGQFFKEIQM